MLPRNPMQGGMGPRMMGSGFGGGGPMMGMNRMSRPPMMNPMMRGPRQLGQGGGLLSKILGKKNPGGMGGLAGPTRAAGSSGSFMQTLSNPGGLTSFLNNTQQVLKTAQTVGPMLQQYGPLIKNLPAMWKLYRGLKGVSSETEETKDSKPDNNHSEIHSNIEEKEQPKSIKKRTSQKKGQLTNNKNTQGRQKKGASIPKLYI
jgi:hypothetical protein